MQELAPLLALPLGILLPLNIWLGMFVVAALISILNRAQNIKLRRKKTLRRFATRK